MKTFIAFVVLCCSLWFCWKYYSNSQVKGGIIQEAEQQLDILTKRLEQRNELVKKSRDFCTRVMAWNESEGRNAEGKSTEREEIEELGQDIIEQLKNY